MNLYLQFISWVWHSHVRSLVTLNNSASLQIHMGENFYTQISWDDSTEGIIVENPDQICTKIKPPSLLTVHYVSIWMIPFSVNTYQVLCSLCFVALLFASHWITAGHPFLPLLSPLHTPPPFSLPSTFSMTLLLVAFSHPCTLRSRIPFLLLTSHCPILFCGTQHLPHSQLTVLTLLWDCESIWGHLSSSRTYRHDIQVGSTVWAGSLSSDRKPM